MCVKVLFPHHVVAQAIWATAAFKAEDHGKVRFCLSSAGTGISPEILRHPFKKCGLVMSKLKPEPPASDVYLSSPAPVWVPPGYHAISGPVKSNNPRRILEQVDCDCGRGGARIVTIILWLSPCAPFYLPSFAGGTADIAPILPVPSGALRAIASTGPGPPPAQLTRSTVLTRQFRSPARKIKGPPACNCQDERCDPLFTPRLPRFITWYHPSWYPIRSGLTMGRLLAQLRAKSQQQT
jgi:hypothetical protein